MDGDGDGANVLDLERIDYGSSHARRIDQKPRVIQALEATLSEMLAEVEQEASKSGGR